MPKYGGKLYFSLGSFPEVGEKHPPKPPGPIHLHGNNILVCLIFPCVGYSGGVTTVLYLGSWMTRHICRNYDTWAPSE